MIRPACRRLAGAVTFAVVAAVALVVPAVMAHSAASAATCSLASTGGTVVRSVDGRNYRLNVPTGLTSASPLLLSLHGGGQPANLHESESGWNAYAASHHFIVAYPQANSNLWDFAAGSADVTWLRHVVADISANWCVNSRRVHAEGYSNGGSMTNRLACDAADLFASFNSYAGSSATVSGSPCTPTRPVAFGVMVSAGDPITGFAIPNRDEWVSRNACPAGRTEFSMIAQVIHYRPCAAGVEVLWTQYYGGSHNWPVGSASTDIRNRIWGLFQANPLP